MSQEAKRGPSRWALAMAALRDAPTRRRLASAFAPKASWLEGPLAALLALGAVVLAGYLAFAHALPLMGAGARAAYCSAASCEDAAWRKVDLSGPGYGAWREAMREIRGLDPVDSGLGSIGWAWRDASRSKALFATESDLDRFKREARAWLASRAQGAQARAAAEESRLVRLWLERVAEHGDPKLAAREALASGSGAETPEELAAGAEEASRGERAVRLALARAAASAPAKLDANGELRAQLPWRELLSPSPTLDAGLERAARREGLISCMLWGALSAIGLGMALSLLARIARSGGAAIERRREELFRIWEAQALAKAARRGGKAPESPSRRGSRRL